MHTLHPGSQCNQNSYKIVFMEPAHQPPHDTPRAHSTLLHLLSSRARACFLCGRARARLTESLLRLLVGWPPSSLALVGFTPLSQWIDNSWRGLPSPSLSLPLCTLLHQSDRLMDTHDAFHPRSRVVPSAKHPAEAEEGVMCSPVDSKQCPTVMMVV